MSEKFDLVVIGSGPAGEKAGAQAAYHGYSVALVERSTWVGGAAVSNAGIPTKTLRETALYVTGFRRRDVYGGLAPTTSAQEVTDRMRLRTTEVFKEMEQRVRHNIERHKIELIHGEASLGPHHTVRVRPAEGPERTLEGRVILIATGSRPRHPAGVPFDDPDVMDSETVYELNEPFETLVVVGGTTVGCEYASIFAAAGAEVTLIDRSERLLRVLDAELSRSLAESFTKLGMRVVLGGGIRPTIERDHEGLKVTLGTGEILRPDKVLYSAGRTGNTESLNLDEVGVQLDSKGRVLVDDYYETTAEGIYAAGDVIGPPSLASVSMEQGRVAICNALNIPFKDTVDPLAPIGIYSVPEVAMVGLSEEAAQERGVAYEVGRGFLSANTRATIAGSSDGLVKLVFEPRTLKLLGVHILADNAGELIHLGQAVIQFGGAIDHFIHSTFNVPTLTDAYKYAAYDGMTRVGR